MSVRYRPNPFFEQGVRAQAVHQKGMRQITKGVAAAVRNVAPVQTGYYRRHVKADGTVVRAWDWAWHMVEFGTIWNRAYAPLRRGVRAAGLRFKGYPKP